MSSSLDFRTSGCSTDTHGRIWSECSLANPCPGATTHLRGDAEQSRVVAEPKVTAKHRLLARSAPLKYANWPGNNILLSSSTAYPQGVGPVQCFDFIASRDDVEHGKPDNVTRRRDDSYGFRQFILHRLISEDDNSKGETICNSHGRLMKAAKSG